MLFSQIIPHSPSATESKRLFYTSVSLLLSCIQGHRYHVSKFHYTCVAAAKSLKLCLTLRDPIDSSPAGSPVPGILQARTLKWVAISFSNVLK